MLSQRNTPFEVISKDQDDSGYGRPSPSEAARTGKMPGVIEVIGQTGVDARPISAFQHEAEVLAQRGTPFEVVTDPVFENGFWRVTIREIPG